MKAKKGMYSKILKMAREDKVITKKMIDYMFMEMKASMTLVNRNFKWGYVPEHLWEEAYSEIYLGMCSHIGKKIDDKLTVFALLGSVTAKYIFNAGITKYKSKKKHMLLVRASDLKASSITELTDDELMEVKIHHDAITLPADSVYMSISDEENKARLSSIFPEDSFGIMPLVYDGWKIKDIADEIGLHKDYVSKRVINMRNRYLKRINNE